MTRDGASPDQAQVFYLIFFFFFFKNPVNGKSAAQLSSPCTSLQPGHVPPSRAESTVLRKSNSSRHLPCPEPQTLPGQLGQAGSGPLSKPQAIWIKVYHLPQTPAWLHRSRGCPRPSPTRCPVLRGHPAPWAAPAGVHLLSCFGDGVLETFGCCRLPWQTQCKAVRDAVYVAK